MVRVVFNSAWFSHVHSTPAPVTRVETNRNHLCLRQVGRCVTRPQGWLSACHRSDWCAASSCCWWPGVWPATDSTGELPFIAVPAGFCLSGPGWLPSGLGWLPVLRASRVCGDRRPGTRCSPGGTLSEVADCHPQPSWRGSGWYCLWKLGSFSRGLLLSEMGNIRYLHIALLGYIYHSMIFRLFTV